MTIQQGKKQVADFLSGQGIAASEYKLRARTVDFSDLARTSRVFVTVQIHVKHAEADKFQWVSDLTKLAKAAGFRVDFKYDQDPGDGRIFC